MVLLDPQAVRREMALRGVDQGDLTKLAGLAKSTVSAGMNGTPLSAKTFQRLIEALAALPRVGSGLTGIDDATVGRLLAGTNGVRPRQSANSAVESERQVGR